MADGPGGHFQPGHQLATGRPKGSRNKRTEDFTKFREEYLSNGGKNPLERIFELVKSQDESIALQASQWLEKTYGLPYFPRHAGTRVQIPKFQSVQLAEEYLLEISARWGDGEIDTQTALEVFNFVRTWISVQHERAALELKKINIDGPSEQVIHVTGGLPALPGTNITMPLVNGHSAREQLLTAPTDVVPAPGEAPGTNPSPGELKAQGPHPLQKHHFAASAPADQPDDTPAQEDS